MRYITQKNSIGSIENKYSEQSRNIYDSNPYKIEMFQKPYSINKNKNII